MSVTAIVNQKGGVGKTTVTLGLTAVLAAAGRSVLVVDLDPQANATTGLGLWDCESTMADVLANESAGSIASIIVSAGWKMDPSRGGSVAVAPSSPSLSRLEHDLAADVIGGGDRLSVALDGVAASYDHVLIDCAPSLGLLTVNALFAADDVVIVAEPAAWSLDGVEQIVRNVERVASRRGGALSIRGIAVNKLARTRDSAYWNDQIRDTYGRYRIGEPIRVRAAIAEAAAQGLPVTDMTRSGSEESVAEFDSLARSFGFVASETVDPESDAGSQEHPAPGTESLDPVGVASPSVGSMPIGSTGEFSG